MKKLRISLLLTLLTTLMVACSANESYNDYGGDSAQAESAPSRDADMDESEKGYLSASNKPTAPGANSFHNAQDIMTNEISDLMSSSAARTPASLDSTHLFIRNADVRFRVKNVRTSTFIIEKIAAKYGGYVARTGLESNVSHTKRTKISNDSSLVTTYYTVSNNMTLRVPAENLDSTLRTMGPLVEFLDHRRIYVEDVTLRILRERLAARRLASSSKRLENAVDKEPAKLRARAAVEEALYRKKTMADESYLKKLEIMDQIKLSTVTLSVYQNKTWTQEMVANENSVDAYRPGFMHDVGQAFKSGWNGFKSVVIGLLHFWPFFLLIFTILMIVRFILKRQKNKAK